MRRERAYTGPVSEVAARMRQEQRERLARMTAQERLQEALALGQNAIATYAAAHGLDLQAAQKRLEHAAQAGRRFSRVMLAIIG
jgi:hypothetical protein